MKRRRDFNRAYKMLPPKLRKTVQERLMKDVFMVEHNQSFYRKKNGHEGITDYEWKGVQSIFSEYGINVETGEICQITEQS